MFSKSFIGLILLFLTLSINPANLNAEYCNRTVLNSQNSKSMNIEDIYRYERVKINGVWWIIVYNEDGVIVNMYEDPVQE